MSITLNILATYRRPRAVLRGLLAQGRREDRALMFLLAACGLMFVAQWPRLARAAELSEEVPLQGFLAGALFGWLFVAPLLFFALAATLHLGMRALRKNSSWFSARLVLFWSLLAIAPLLLLHGLLAGIVGPVPAVTAFGFVVALCFIYILVQGLREAAQSHHA